MARFKVDKESGKQVLTDAMKKGIPAFEGFKVRMKSAVSEVKKEASDIKKDWQCSVLSACSVKTLSSLAFSGDKHFSREILNDLKDLTDEYLEDVQDPGAIDAMHRLMSITTVTLENIQSGKGDISKNQETFCRLCRDSLASTDRSRRCYALDLLVLLSGEDASSLASKASSQSR